MLIMKRAAITLLVIACCSASIWTVARGAPSDPAVKPESKDPSKVDPAPQIEPLKTANPAPKLEPSKSADPMPKDEPSKPANPAPKVEASKPANPPPKVEASKPTNSSPKVEASKPANPAPKVEPSKPSDPVPKDEPSKPANPALKVEPSNAAVKPVDKVSSSNETDADKPKKAVDNTLTYAAQCKEVLRSENQLYSGCRSGKRCLGLPLDCLDSMDCDAAVAVSGSGGSGGYTIDLLGRLPRGLVQYVAVGFSEDPRMGDDLVIECVAGDTDRPVKAFRSYNLPHDLTNRREKDQNGIYVEYGNYVDGTMFCSVQHNSSVTVEGGRVFDLERTPYHLLIAAGTDLAKNGVGYHSTSMSSQDKTLIPAPKGL